MKKTLLTLVLSAFAATAAHAEFKAGMTPAQVSAEIKAQVAKAPVPLSVMVAAAKAAGVSAGSLMQGMKLAAQYPDQAVITEMMRNGYSAADAAKAAAEANVPAATITAALVAGGLTQADARNMTNAATAGASKSDSTTRTAGSPSSSGSGASGSGGGGSTR